MDIRQELAGRILNGESIEAVLVDYIISRIGYGGDISKRIEHFINAKRIDGLSEESLKNYKYTLNIFAARVNKDVTAITADDIREHISFLSTEKKLKSNTLQNKINTLSSFFGWLLVEEIIGKNPMLKIKTPKQSNKHFRQGLSIENLELLRESCITIKDRALIEFFVSTGCRVSEVSTITVGAIKWHERSVVVFGKGNKERTVYFTHKAKMLLQTYLQQRKGGIALFAADRVPYAGLQPRALQTCIKSISKRVKLDVTPHVLRHTFASLALQNGMDLTVIQLLLGHEDFKTTQIYAKESETRARQQHERFVA